MATTTLCGRNLRCGDFARIGELQLELQELQRGPHTRGELRRIRRLLQEQQRAVKAAQKEWEAMMRGGRKFVDFDDLF